jgi:hypothetical protein
MTDIRTVDLPQWEVLPSGFPSYLYHGGFLVNDRRGTDRYIYIYYPNNDTPTTYYFIRFDTQTETWQLLATPSSLNSLRANGVFDPSKGASGYVWLLSFSSASAPWFGYYDIALNTWTSCSTVGLPTVSTGCIAHTCSTYNVAGNDDYIYACVYNSTTMYRYSISGNTWTTLTAMPSVGGEDVKLLWMPGWNTDRIVRVACNTNSVIDYYSILSDNWTAVNYLPNVKMLWGRGSHWASNGINTPEIYMEYTDSSVYYKLDLSAGTLTPVARQGLRQKYITTGIMTNKLVYAIVDGAPYLYTAFFEPYSPAFSVTPSTMMRTRLLDL